MRLKFESDKIQKTLPTYHTDSLCCLLKVITSVNTNSKWEGQTSVMQSLDVHLRLSLSLIVFICLVNRAAQILILCLL